jgi:hypothetical protein
VPTFVELLAAQRLNPWLGVILSGDLIGGMWLIAVFKMRRTGLSLYLLLIACEGSLYEFHILTINALLWIVDIVPTLAVAAIIPRALWQPRPGSSRFTDSYCTQRIALSDRRKRKLRDGGQLHV